MSAELHELKESLERLGDSTQAIPFSVLFPLSDLAGEQWSEFLAAWTSLSPDQRRRAAKALVELAEVNFGVNFDAIFRLCLDDADEQVRAIAIDGLWENEQVTLIGPLLKILRTDPSVQVRAAAASGLGRYMLAAELEELAEPIQNRIMTELLSTIHLGSESVEVRRRAIESVAYAGTPEVLEILEAAYFDDDEAMQISAVVGMGRSCDDRWQALVLQELESDSAAMRYEAAWASGELALQAAVPILARLIYDPDQQVSSASIWALGQIGGILAKQILFTAYDEADDDTRNALGEALSELALIEGDLDFSLYEFDDGESNDLLKDDLVPLWSAEADAGGYADMWASEEDVNDLREDWEFDDL